jgi:hypothetical protein
METELDDTLPVASCTVSVIQSPNMGTGGQKVHEELFGHSGMTVPFRSHVKLYGGTPLNWLDVSV